MYPRDISGHLRRGPRIGRVVAVGSGLVNSRLCWGRRKTHEFSIFLRVLLVAVWASSRCCLVSSCDTGFLNVFIGVEGWDSLGGGAVCNGYVEVDVGGVFVPVDGFVLLW